MTEDVLRRLLNDAAIAIENFLWAVPGTPTYQAAYDAAEQTLVRIESALDGD